MTDDLNFNGGNKVFKREDASFEKMGSSNWKKWGRFPLT